jgi:hypothetical protein
MKLEQLLAYEPQAHQIIMNCRYEKNKNKQKEYANHLFNMGIRVHEIMDWKTKENSVEDSIAGSVFRFYDLKINHHKIIRPYFATNNRKFLIK